MACGKTSIGKLVARALDMPFVDTDGLVESEAGKSIERIFAEDGEPAFRNLEKAMLKKVCMLRNTVVALGGGALVDPGSLALASKEGIVIGLTASAHEIMCRTMNDNTRPLLADCDGQENLRRIEALLEERLASLEKSHFIIDTSGLDLEQSCNAVLRFLFDYGYRPYGEGPHNVSGLNFMKVTHKGAQNSAGCGSSFGGGYSILIGDGLLKNCGSMMSPLFSKRGFSRKTAIITNTLVEHLYSGMLRSSLSEAGLEPVVVTIPDGEDTKSLATASAVYDKLALEEFGRNCPLLALGGGVTGDLAGFVASTYMRGIPLIQIPTTLLAQVDSSVGGKTAVNHPKAKNLIGSFYNPAMVIIDTNTLMTLPDREYTEGLAEAVKYGIAMDKNFFHYIQENAGAILARDSKTLEDLIRRSCRLKAEVVEKDLMETGPRTILNFGHTIGHAIEAAPGYGKLRHGEAISIGMALAMWISVESGMMGRAEMSQATKLLADLGLPTRTSLEFGDLAPFLQLDKKAVSGRLRFVLCQGLGKARVTEDLDAALIKKALEQQPV
ncbi:MAG TPA: 3-dehydroquinate synthase [Firmicutes bacterium]|nr:3-dehydroquinate synthase [Bacillota bacterium]